MYHLKYFYVLLGSILWLGPLQAKQSLPDTVYFRQEFETRSSQLFSSGTDGPLIGLADSLLMKREGYSVTSKEYTVLTDLHRELLERLAIHYYQTEGESESFLYYKELILNKAPITNSEIGLFYMNLGFIDLMMPIDYVNALKNFEGASEYLKETEAIAYWGLLVMLMETYKEVEAYDQAWEVVALAEILIQETDLLNDESTVLLTNIKLDILLNEKRPEEALALMEGFDCRSCNEDNKPIRFILTSTKVYLSNRMPDKALELLSQLGGTDLAHNDYSNKARMLGSWIALQKGKLIDAENQLEKIRDYNFSQSQDRLLKYEIAYEIKKKQQRFEEALLEYERYHALRESLSIANARHRSEIMNYRMNKERELVSLNEANLVKDGVIKRERVLYALASLIVLGGLFYFIRISNIKKREQLKLLEKTREIAIAKSNFLENLSHEIRTPITVISGYLSLLRNYTMSPGHILKYTERASKSSDGIIDALNNFLTLTKLEKTVMDFPESSAPLGNFIEDMVHSFEPSARVKKLKLYSKTNIKSDAKVSLSYESLNKVISNLISNAIKYTESGKSIFVSSLLVEHTLTIEVKDEGIGIAENELGLIFDRFYQSEQHRVTGGFGIGLSLVNELVAKMGGTIAVSSKKGLGTNFKVSIPLALNESQFYVEEMGSSEYECLSCEETEEVIDITDSNLPRALIVDDNLEMLGYLGEFLTRDLNCEYAFNGREGLEKAKSAQYDIIISDLRMPEMDGVEFKSELNKLENYKEVPFILLTASPQEFTEELKQTLGINEYILKPFGHNEIMTRIRYLLENKIYQKKMCSLEDEETEFHAAHSEIIEKININILSNISDSDFTVKELADLCGYSQSQLSRIVKKKTGMSLVKIILEIRLLKSYELITKNIYQTVSEVVYAVGLNSKSYFHKKFVERFGINPGDLLKTKTGAENQFI